MEGIGNKNHRIMAIRIFQVLHESWSWKTNRFVKLQYFIVTSQRFLLVYLIEEILIIFSVEIDFFACLQMNIIWIDLCVVDSKPDILHLAVPSIRLPVLAIADIFWGVFFLCCSSIPL